MGSIAAPLLAGFSVALAIFLAQSKEASGWESFALSLLVVAALAFIAAVQLTFRARQFAVTPPEIEMWWSDPNEPGRREMLRTEQRFYHANHSVWAKRAGWAYDLGLPSFLLGVTASLVPPGGLFDASAGRLAVVVLALLGFVAELAWLRRTRSGSIFAAEWPPAPGPEMES
jgi:hypothetical protein